MESFKKNLSCKEAYITPKKKCGGRKDPHLQYGDFKQWA